MKRNTIMGIVSDNEKHLEELLLGCGHQSDLKNNSDKVHNKIINNDNYIFHIYIYYILTYIYIYYYIYSVY